MARHYAVTITASRTAVEPQALARRLAELLDATSDEIEEALRGDTVILERELSYREATEIQRELSRRKIPSQVSAHQKLSGRELLLRGGESATNDDVKERDVDAPSSERTEALPSTKKQQDGSDAANQGEEEASAWTELFPELAQDQSESKEADIDIDDCDNGRQGEESGGWDSQSWLEIDEDSEQSRVPTPASGGEAQGAPKAKPQVDAGGFGAVDAEQMVVEEEADDFDANKIRQAFADNSEDRPPHKPKGYDDRPEHVPLIAALLSLLAPGAGQLLNGQPDKAQRYAVTFFLIYPWFDSVRQAWRYGEKIRTYYAPRADRGAGKRAVLFGLKWWAVIAILAMTTNLTISTIQDYQQQQQERRNALVFQELVYFGHDVTADAVRDAKRVADNTEIEESTEEQRQAYTMDAEERARRLFIIGYHYCRGGEYRLCQQMMSRVTSVAPNNRDAFRLQAWASMQDRGVGERREMPEVEGHVPTLDAFELELATQGQSIGDIDEHFDNWWNEEGFDAVSQREGEWDEYDEMVDEELEGGSEADESEAADD